MMHERCSGPGCGARGARHTKQSCSVHIRTLPRGAEQESVCWEGQQAPRTSCPCQAVAPAEKLTEKSRQVCGLQQAPPRSCCAHQRGIKPRDPSFSWAHRASRAVSIKKEGVNPQGRAQRMPSPAIHLCHSAPTKVPEP